MKPMALLVMVGALLSGCVTPKTYRQGKEAAYHRGRREVIKTVDKWLGQDMSREDVRALVGSLGDIELLWQIYFYRPLCVK